MKHINRRKNGGSMLIELLENAYEDLNDGDQYVYLGKHNRVLNKGSERTDESRIGRLMWAHNVKDVDKVVIPFNILDYIDYKEYLTMFKSILKKHKNDECYHRGVIINIKPTPIKTFIREQEAFREHLVEIANVITENNQ